LQSSVPVPVPVPMPVGELGSWGACGLGVAIGYCWFSGGGAC
jgi:hypothetical protein